MLSWFIVIVKISLHVDHVDVSQILLYLVTCQNMGVNQMGIIEN